MPFAVSLETRPHLAVFLTSFHPGGTERQMVQLVRRLDPSRFAVHVACLHREGAWLAEAEAGAVEVAEFPLRGFADPSGIRAVRGFARWCRERAIQILQTCDFYSNVVGMAGAALARVPVRIASRREIAPDKSRAQLALQRAAYVAAHRIVANSRAASNQLVNEGVDASRVRVIPNGIDLKRFPALARNGRVRRIVIVANLRSEKCHDVLLRAFARVAGMPELPRDLSLHVVGDGPLRQALEAQTRALGVEDRVSFLGHREDISALLASSDLFVLPSRSEAFPNSVMEAMASGMPVIASAVGGLLDLVEDGRNGLLVPPDDPEALGGAIARLVAQPTLAASLGASARRHVRERYSFDRMIASFEHLYLTELHARVPLAAERPAVTVP